MKGQSEITLRRLAQSWPHPKLDELDMELSLFIRGAPLSRNFCWLQAMRLALGLSGSGLAEKLKVNRQAIQQYEQSERSGAISIKTLQKIADSIDCQLVYGIVPKEHSSFAEMVTAKALPFVQKPEIPARISPPRRRQIISQRIKMFLSQPTGWGHLWQVKKALLRPYNWIWADSELVYHPHGIRISRKSKK